MAHAEITLPKANLTGVSNIATWAGGTASVPATLMNGSNAGSINSFVLTGATSRSANITISLAFGSGGDLSSSMETGGTIDMVYGDTSARITFSSGGSGDTIFADTSNPYSWTAVYATEGDVLNKLRWVLETIDADRIAGTHQHDLVLTLWDGQGTSPFPADPTPTYDAEQTFTATAAEWNTNSVRYAVIPSTPRPAFDTAFKPDSDDKFLEQIVMRRDRSGIILFVAGSASAARTNTPAEPLSSAFLERGEIELTVSGMTVVVPMGGPDVFDPRNADEAPDTTEFYRVDFRGLTSIRYERWVESFAVQSQVWQGIFRIRAADGGVVPPPMARQGLHLGSKQVTGVYLGAKPVKAYLGSKLVADYRP